jgi:NAD(P)-dependent dehydrogenase (short-subunit alcohol dehydrogenase family)
MTTQENNPPHMPVALVTGGARGIGAAIAARLARDGYQLIIADLHAPEDAILGRHVICDIASESDVAALMTDIRAREGRLDALVCNAGINIRKSVEELSLGEWSRVIATNLTSSFLLVRSAASLLRQGAGAVVTIASTRAHMSEPDTEAYAASKGGLVALTHALAISLGPDIRVNCISPGWIHNKGEAPRPADHEDHPVGRVGVADDVAGLAAFLLGPESGFITGAEFIIDGGMTRKMKYLD